MGPADEEGDDDLENGVYEKNEDDEVGANGAGGAALEPTFCNDPLLKIAREGRAVPVILLLLAAF